MKIVLPFFLLFFITPSVLSSQNAVLQHQTDEFWHLFKTKIEPLPIILPECPIIRELQGNTSFWINEVDRLRSTGAFNCCMNILSQIEPLAKRQDRDYITWLLQKTNILISIEKLNEIPPLLEQLEQLTSKTGVSISAYKYTAARFHDSKREFQGALKNAEEALQIARNEGDKKLQAKALNQISSTSRDIYMREPYKYTPYIEQAYEISQSLKDTSMMMYELLGLSFCFQDEGAADFEKAGTYLSEAFNLVTPQMSLKDRMSFAQTLAGFFEINNMYDKGAIVREHAIKLAKVLNDRSLVQNMYEQLADDYEIVKDYDFALAMMDSAKAYCDFNREMGYFYNSYAHLYEAKGNLPLAIEYYQKAFDEQVKGYTNRNAALLTETETRLRTQEKELELKQQRSQRWLFIGIALLTTTLFGFVLWAYWRNKRQLVLLKQQNILIEKQDAELRQLDAAKTRFFANVSHELRTPLTLILGPLSHLLKGNELNNKQFTMLSLIKQNAQNLLQLTNEILDLSKLEAGKMQLNVEPTVLYPFIRRLVASFESHAEKQNIRLTFDYHPDRYLQIELDIKKFEKIINNLLSNAIKFTQSGGVISVSVFEKPNMIELTVKDTGRGIHPDDLPHVFNRFYQSNQPDAPTEGGTGIGLSLSMEFAKLFNGKLWVESILNQGSIFHFTFPKREVMGTIPQDVALEIQNGVYTNTLQLEPRVEFEPSLKIDSNPTILIVEDNPSLRDYLKVLLNDKYNIITAENGLVALDILTEQHNKMHIGNPQSLIPNSQSSINLIISDIMMPVMDGFQFLEVVKNRDYFKQIPVIMLTARAEVRDKLKALRIGVDDYLIKPFEEDELFARIDNLLKNSALRQSFKSELVENAEITEGAGFELKIGSDTQNQESNEFNAWLEELEAVIQKHIGDFNLTADTIADNIAMSRSQFFRRLKVATGLTPNQYLLEVRFNHARQLLELKKEQSVKGAAYSVGMRDVKYFSQQFKERFGRLPSDYLLTN